MLQLMPSIVMHQPVAQTCDHIPRLLGMRLLPFTAQLIYLLAYIIERRCDSPLRELILQQYFRCNSAFFNLFF